MLEDPESAGEFWELSKGLGLLVGLSDLKDGRVSDGNERRDDDRIKDFKYCT